MRWRVFATVWWSVLAAFLMATGVWIMGGIFAGIAIFYVGQVERAFVERRSSARKPPVEPAANVRQAAHGMAEMRAALIEAGYTEQQAAIQIAEIVRVQNR